MISMRSAEWLLDDIVYNAEFQKMGGCKTQRISSLGRELMAFP
jgi:hypothetical protein